jgi:hypothetical protein
MLKVRFGEAPKPAHEARALPVLRRHYVVVANDVVDFHDVDPISKAARVATIKHR